MATGGHCGSSGNFIHLKLKDSPIWFAKCKGGVIGHRGYIIPAFWHYKVIELRIYNTVTVSCLTVGLSGSVSFPTVILSLLLVPSGVPQAVLAVATGSTSISVQWDRVSCINRNSEITGYTLRYAPSGAPSDIPIFGTTRSDRTYTITGLSVAANYNISVAANSSGVTTGPFSVPINVETYGEHSL